MDSAALPRQNTATAASMRVSAASVRGSAAAVAVISPSPVTRDKECRHRISHGDQGGCTISFSFSTIIDRRSLFR
jgi:hypothetical protein